MRRRRQNRTSAVGASATAACQGLLASGILSIRRSRIRSLSSRRLAFSEVHDDETTATTVGFWGRALAFFAVHGITAREVLSDHGPNYCSRD